ncbi:hypothetical protein I4U23_030419 [Adineta vaga]|nr:hypothetical protein I4U23_030419 [Adineta vaga]
MNSAEDEDDVPSVFLLDPFVHMSAGDRHSILVTEDGRTYAFGDNNSGQLGLGHTNPVKSVSCIKSLQFTNTDEKVLLVACGRESSIVATNYGSLYSFGSNNHCQLGFESDESCAIHSSPIQIDSFHSKISWKQISMGAEHTCALTNDGIVYTWGSNEDGQCGHARKYDHITKPKKLLLDYNVSTM